LKNFDSISRIVRFASKIGTNGNVK
jgi:hypothetical protein